MKIISRVVLPFLAFILIYSCTSSLSLTKRRYMHGYFAEHSHKIKKQNKIEKDVVLKENQVVVKKEETSAPLLLEENSLPADQQVLEEVTVAGTVAKEIKHGGKEKEATLLQNSNSENKPKEESLKVRPHLQKIDRSAGVDGAASDVLMLLLLVILSIILPPLAVYLKQNEASKWFWVTFVLCLLAILGFLITFIVSLWFVAIVIALLVVLDIVS